METRGPSANVERLRAGINDFNERGMQAILDLIHPDFVAIIPPSLSVEPDTYRGEEGMRRYFEIWADVVDDIKFNASEYIDAGDKVIVVTRLVTRSRETQLELGQDATMVWELRDGKAVSVEAFATKQEALAAVGPGA